MSIIEVLSGAFGGLFLSTGHPILISIESNEVFENCLHTEQCAKQKSLHRGI